MNNDNVNQEEIKSIIRTMSEKKPVQGFNERAAQIVQTGVQNKLAEKAAMNPFKPKGKLLS
jgi:hypothetical protein